MRITGHFMLKKIVFSFNNEFFENVPYFYFETLKVPINFKYFSVFKNFQGVAPLSEKKNLLLSFSATYHLPEVVLKLVLYSTIFF